MQPRRRIGRANPESKKKEAESKSGRAKNLEDVCSAGPLLHARKGGEHFFRIGWRRFFPTVRADGFEDGLGGDLLSLRGTPIYPLNFCSPHPVPFQCPLLATYYEDDDNKPDGWR